MIKRTRIGEIWIISGGLQFWLLSIANRSSSSHGLKYKSMFFHTV